ncbi:MAG: AAA family ATPase [Phycisphaerales bacterium]|nr:AAA family ATPase [Phycisphaerales bacterium]
MFIVEGERCADALAGLGLVAVTSAGGAKAADKSDWSALAGRKVVLCPDFDAAGEEYIRDVSSALAALSPPSVISGRLRVTEHGTGGDVADWIGARAAVKPVELRTELLARISTFDWAAIPPTRGDGSEGRAKLLCLADVRSSPVRWLWPGRIALGKLTMLSGDPGLGKSLLALDLAARLSAGKPWPDGAENMHDRSSVVLLSAEDDPGDTLRPRLDAAGADASRINVLTAVVRQDGTDAHFDFSADLATLREAIVETPGCRLVIIDPISAYLGATDSHSNAEVRGVLAPLGALAADCDVAIVAITHLRKGEGPAIHRSIGSIAFVAAARAAYVVTPDQDDAGGTRRLFLPMKNNLGNDRTGLAFSVESAGDSAIVKWSREPVTTRADDGVAPVRSRRPSVEVDAAAEWLRELLADGPRDAKEVFAAAAEAGFSGATIKRARRLAQIRPRKRGFEGGWVWALDGERQSTTEVAQAQPRSNGVSSFGLLPPTHEEAQMPGAESPADGSNGPLGELRFAHGRPNRAG